MVEPAAAVNCRLIRNQPVRMRDGVQLATSIYLPLQPEPCPAVLVRTAYNRAGFFDPFFPKNGLALVVQDVRGRYASEGRWEPVLSEKDDGYEAGEWVARQPWCNGKVGMYGDSYLGATQYQAALSDAPHLSALNPRFMSGDCWKRAYFCDGAFSLGLTWSWLCFECNGRTSEAQQMPLFDVGKLLKTLPVRDLDVASGAGRVAHYRQYVQQQQYGEIWEALSIRDHYEHFDMPVLLTGGWYDYYAGEAPAIFNGIREHAADPKTRSAHRLIIGPWTHGIHEGSELGEIDFGKEAEEENDSTQRWLSCMLKGGNAEEFQASPVRVFTMGVNRWEDFQTWPPAAAADQCWYLQPGGGLAPQEPTGSNPSRYRYDPDDPVPTRGGNHSIGPYNPGLYDLAPPGPYDQRPIEERDDVLVFTSEPLEVPLQVTGRLRMKLFAASSCPDTDFVARLTDVFPDGRSINIAEGIIRVRYRESIYGEPVLMEPGEVYEFAIDMQITSNVFQRGHRLRVDVTSSSWPLWDRNLNVAESPESATHWEVAEQQIFHEPAHPSHILLPVVPSGS